MKSIKEIDVVVRRRHRFGEEPAPYNVAVSCPKVVAEIAKKLLADRDSESFLVFLLDIKNKPIGYQEAARGGIDVCPVDPRVVFRAAVVQGASSVIVVHNHPSGDPSPSSEDIKLTARLHKGGELLGVQVLDHLVVAGDRNFSFAEKGMMP